ncbi:ameloblastin isoform X2 [Ornithorhynchus anatinus]|uniref:ameloblastin isoform X2 n=1 Tax=Ornithorhynchus anatinus TaxID=9258 RepID=UPI0019D4C302|nr:ameloblastin isoform X2 [Ornithorhynchus anatinus]
MAPIGQDNPEDQDQVLPTGQSGMSPATQDTPEDQPPTASGLLDESEVTLPANLQGVSLTTEESTTEEPRGPTLKMENLVLILSLFGTSFAIPVFLQPGGPPGMGSLSLETMRHLGNLNLLPQFSRFGFGKQFNSLWMHGFLPPHSNYPWLSPRDQETQQYEYALPVHPPPRPSQRTLQPQQPKQNAFLPPTVAPSAQGPPAQNGDPQPPILHLQPPLQQEEKPSVQEQLPALDFTVQLRQSIFPIAQKLISQGPRQKAEQSPLYPELVYVPFGANQQNAAPARLGKVSSEEMPGGGGEPLAYGSIFPGFGSMRPGFGAMQINPALGKDFTLEDDSPTVAGKPPGQGGEVLGSPRDGAIPAGHPNPGLLPERISRLRSGAALTFPSDFIPHRGQGPAGQSKLPPGVTPPPADPLMTPGPSDPLEFFEGDGTTPLGLQREALLDTTMTPDTQSTYMPGNEAQQMQVTQDQWQFQEP